MLFNDRLQYLLSCYPSDAEIYIVTRFLIIESKGIVINMIEIGEDNTHEQK